MVLAVGVGILVVGYALNLWVRMELPKRTPELRQSQSCNFCLRVSNQSVELRYVNIQVFVDDKLAIDDNFQVGSGHNFPRYNFKLPEGKHNIKVRTRNGNAVFDGQFDVSRKLDAFITYSAKKSGGYFGQIEGKFRFEILPEGIPVIIQ